MGRPRKKHHRQPSIIDSDMDRRFSEPLSLSDSSSGSEGESSSHEPEGDNVIQEPQPVVVPQKRAKPGSVDYIACLSPELQDSVKSASRKSTAEKYIVERKELTLSQLNGCNLDIAADSAVHG